jgi:hypothetical protein
MRNMRHRLGDQGQVFRNDRRIHDLDVPCERADSHHAVTNLNSLQLIDAINIDEKLRLRQTHVQRRYKTLAAVQDTRSSP